jgi:DNA mismatch repair protein MutS
VGWNILIQFDFTSGQECLVLDAVSVRNLELVEPLFSGESAQTTLFHTLDACATPMGKAAVAGDPAAPVGRPGGD